MVNVIVLVVGAVAGTGGTLLWQARDVIAQKVQPKFQQLVAAAQNFCNGSQAVNAGPATPALVASANGNGAQATNPSPVPATVAASSTNGNGNGQQVVPSLANRKKRK